MNHCLYASAAELKSLDAKMTARRARYTPALLSGSAISIPISRPFSETKRLALASVQLPVNYDSRKSNAQVDADKRQRGRRNSTPSDTT
jgi:hypothetical protein